MIDEDALRRARFFDGEGVSSMVRFFELVAAPRNHDGTRLVSRLSVRVASALGVAMLRYAMWLGVGLRK
jgi:hypothetical protein